MMAALARDAVPVGTNPLDIPIGLALWWIEASGRLATATMETA